MKNVLFLPFSCSRKVVKAALMLLCIFAVELTFAQDAVLLGSFLKDKKSKNYTYRKDIFGNTEIVDERLQVVGKITKNIFGDRVLEDEKGQTVLKLKMDIFGNTILECSDVGAGSIGSQLTILSWRP